jgi:uronate dehydrogenase
MKVLITGAGGCVGRRLSRHLAPRHELVLGDLQPGPDFRHLDITRLGSVEAACAGIDAVIHLAVASGMEGEIEDDAFNELRWDINVKGTGHVFEAAVRCGVRRVVHTSSLMVVWGYGPGEYVGPDAEPRPVGTYAITKHLGEVIARDYHQRHGLSTVCLRIAKPVDVEDPATRPGPIRPQWIAFPDLCRAYELALTAPDIGFEIMHMVGESSARRWDLSKAEQVLGYRPEYRLEEMGYEFSASTVPITAAPEAG